MINLNDLGSAKVVGLDYPKPLYESDDDNLEYLSNNHPIGKFSSFVEQYAKDVLQIDSSKILWKQIVKNPRSDYILKEEDVWTQDTVGFVYITKEDYLKEFSKQGLSSEAQTRYFMGVLDNYNAAINGYT